MPAVESNVYCSESYAVPTTSIGSQLIDISQFCATQNTRFQSEMPAFPAAGPSPKLSIVEPFDRRSRFRYKSEQGNHGILKCNKNIPTVKLENYSGKQKLNVRATICTNEKNPKLHVHNIRHSDENGIIEPLNEKMMASFTMSIEHCGVKSKEDIIFKRLKLQDQCCGIVQDERVLKKKAMEQAKSIDLNSIKVLFEAIEVNSERVIASVYSSPIYHQSDVKITTLSKSSSPFTGNERIILLCSKVDKKKIRIRFFELNEKNEIVWQQKGIFTEADIHYQCAIVFLTPPYDGRSQLDEGVKVYIQLYNSTSKVRSQKIEDDDIVEGSLSDPVEFYYYPVDEDEEGVRRKRLKTNPIAGSLDSRGSFRELNSQYVESSPQNAVSSPEKLNYVEGSQGFSNRLSNQCLNNDEFESDLLSAFPPNLIESIDGKVIDIDDCMSNPEFGMSANSEDPMFSSTSPYVAVPISSPNQEPTEPVIYSQCLYVPESTSRNFNRSNFTTDSVAVTNSEENVSDEEELSERIKNLDLLTENESSDFTSKLGLECKSEKSIKVVDENGNTQLHLAISRTSQSEISQNLLLILKRSLNDIVNQRNKRGQTPLHLGAQKKFVTAVRLLLLYGADPNLSDKNGNTVLHLASRHKSSDCLQEILRSKKPLELNAVNHDVLTPLQMSMICQSEECFRILVEAGANINVRDNRSGKTLLHLAVQHMPSVVRFILSKGVNVDEQDYAGNTALHVACLNNELDAAKALMEYEANPLIPNFEEEEEEMTSSSQNKGKTAYDFACGNHKLCQILSGEAEYTETKTVKLSLDCSHSNSNSDDLDSGYISTDEITLLDNATMSKLEKVLNQDNKWKKLSDVCLDEVHSNNICKLDGKNPTRALFRCLEKNGWTTEFLSNVLDAAELPEAYHIVKDFLNKKSQP